MDRGLTEVLDAGMGPRRRLFHGGRAVVAVRALDSRPVDTLRVRYLGDHVVAIDAGPHFVVLDGEGRWREPVDRVTRLAATAVLSLGELAQVLVTVAVRAPVGR